MASESGFSYATAIVLLHLGPAGGHDLFDGWIGMRLTASCGEPEIWLPSLVFRVLLLSLCCILVPLEVFRVKIRRVIEAWLTSG